MPAAGSWRRSRAGAELPFELVEERGGSRVPLYCYRPLTDEFIRQRMPILREPATYDARVRRAVGLRGARRLPESSAASCGCRPEPRRRPRRR